MLTFFIGQKNGEAGREIDKRLSQARTEGEVVVFSDTTTTRESLSSYLGAGDLFGRTYTIFLDRTFANQEVKEFVFKELKTLVVSENVFFLLEEKLLADDIKTIEKAGGEVVKDIAKTIKKREDFNIFALGDALGARDKKGLWVLYEKALRAGKSPEEILGILLWQLKSMRMVSLQEDAGLNPFVKMKAARFVKNYSSEEIKQLLFKYTSEYHDSRRGGLPLEGRIEKLILSL